MSCCNKLTKKVFHKKVDHLFKLEKLKHQKKYNYALSVCFEKIKNYIKVVKYSQIFSTYKLIFT